MLRKPKASKVQIHILIPMLEILCVDLHEMLLPIYLFIENNYIPPIGQNLLPRAAFIKNSLNIHNNHT